MNELNVIVRREYISPFDEDGYLIMFYKGYKRHKPIVESFTFLDGHNEASVEYVNILDSKVHKADAKFFINSVQKYYDSLPNNNVKLVLKDVLIIE